MGNVEISRSLKSKQKPKRKLKENIPVCIFDEKGFFCSISKKALVLFKAKTPKQILEENVKKFMPKIQPHLNQETTEKLTEIHKDLSEKKENLTPIILRMLSLTGAPFWARCNISRVDIEGYMYIKVGFSVEENPNFEQKITEKRKMTPNKSISECKQSQKSSLRISKTISENAQQTIGEFEPLDLDEFDLVEDLDSKTDANESFHSSPKYTGIENKKLNRVEKVTSPTKTKRSYTNPLPESPRKLESRDLAMKKT
eukprot:Anaeramoba_ignava/c20639_g1_i1.p2 GENE.c20639_g1_i1~~c20639_g1_i1.p2  ORF type:complete len:256 (-),score=72.02 c20639_g1_i1:2046-2813(-)